MKSKISFALQLFVAIIYVQTLYFKFSAHPDSVYIFTVLGIEPYGRIGLGIAELVLAISLIISRTKVIASFFSLGLISGAILAHIGPLGIVVKNDGGKVFVLALLVWLGSLAILLLHTNELKASLTKFSLLTKKLVLKPKTERLS